MRHSFLFQHPLSQLTKLPLALLVGFSAFFGHLTQGEIDAIEGAYSFLGVFFLASGGAILNNFQDIDIDKEFQRTKNRPLITGLISCRKAIFLSLIFLILGSSLLYLSRPGWALPLLGMISVLMYNWVYTYSKRKTIFSIIPGAICGMLPPYIGFVAQSGEFFNFSIVIVTMVLFFWQLPHFWLITAYNPQDYQSIKSPVPSLLGLLGQAKLNRIILIWGLSYALITLFIPLQKMVNHPGVKIAFLINALSISLFLFLKLIRSNPTVFDYKKSFMGLNVSFLNVMLLVVIERACF